DNLFFSQAVALVARFRTPKSVPTLSRRSCRHAFGIRHGGHSDQGPRRMPEGFFNSPEAPGRTEMAFPARLCARRALGEGLVPDNTDKCAKEHTEKGGRKLDFPACGVPRHTAFEAAKANKNGPSMRVG